MAILDNQQSQGSIDNQMEPFLKATDNIEAPLYDEGPSIVNDYHIQEGAIILPVAESPPTDPNELQNWSPVCLLRLHSPYRIRTARFVTKKNMDPPVLPSPKSTGAFMFLGGDLTFTNVLNLNGTFNWSAKTEYTYVENCVSRTVDGFVLGNPGYAYPIQQINAATIGGAPGVPPIGAIFYAGVDAKIGYFQSQNRDDNTIVLPENLNILSTYNTPSYFPGTVFNDELMNGPSLVNGNSPELVSI